MSIFKINNKSVINPESITAMYNRQNKGISILGNNLSLLAFIDEEDIDSSSAMLKELITKITKLDKKNKIIILQNYSLLHIDHIGAMNVSDNKFIISSKDNKVIYWLETDSDEEAELICSEVVTAYEYAEKGKRYNIDWEILNTETA